jgi:hypothetical protein
MLNNKQGDIAINNLGIFLDFQAGMKVERDSGILCPGIRSFAKFYNYGQHINDA